MTFGKFADQPALCVASLLLFYMDKTKNNSEVSGDTLFLTLGKKVRVASSQTISRWIKETFFRTSIVRNFISRGVKMRISAREACVKPHLRTRSDINIFTTYSTRHASTSSAARFGVSMDEIRRAAGWSPNSATFARFYDRPLIPSGSLAEAFILNR